MTTDSTQTPTPIVTPPAAPVTPVAAPRQNGGRWLNLVLVGALAIAIGGIAFALGRSTAPAATTTVTGFGPGMMVGPQGSVAPGAGGPNGAGTGPMFASGGPTIDGVVASIGDGTMTITLASGETVTVNIDDATTYHSAAEASEEDVAVGDDVAVHVSGGGRFGVGANASAVPSLTAGDVTVIE
jgi:hypothetical protein